MAPKDIGALTGADESLNHQIVDTFATVAESDLAWTEKIWGSLASTDGSLQVDFGLGKYRNRGVIDGFAGVSRGREQWTVRGSRELRSAPDETTVGPIEYEVLDSLKQVRFRLAPNDVQPISFDLVLTGVTPPFFEDRNLVRNRNSGRLDINVVRYHQGGHVRGSVTVDGETVEIDDDSWFGFRDHSWGIRQSVGVQPSDLIQNTAAQPGATAGHAADRSGMKWTPAFLRRPDGSYYEMAVFVAQGAWGYASAYVNEASGAQTRIRDAEVHISYDPRTRFVRGGELHLVTEAGDRRVIEVEALGESGFFLKTGGYGSWGSHIHGSWMGPLHLEGDYIDDCWFGKHARELGQLRDTPIRVREGDAVGYGIMESIVHGVWPELGLTAETDYRASYSA
ncbi:hypothetical protein MXD61_14430 [Frankia sp. AgPm24]|uniref:hypothetical protein n=1 Tax=Frankia sp. AgPm24 TaxID=631128 RepID=UPI0020106960|nr:hypothetical protein [Frankia sp. AgPm24]MCK9923053.1 hypothetical protein [Frankia sp. AgPm24]